MKITCPTCSAIYQIPIEKLGEKGRIVRCASCSDSWRATPHSNADQSVAAPPVNHNESDTHDATDSNHVVESLQDIPGFSESIEDAEGEPTTESNSYSALDETSDEAQAPLENIEAGENTNPIETMSSRFSGFISRLRNRDKPKKKKRNRVVSKARVKHIARRSNAVVSNVVTSSTTIIVMNTALCVIALLILVGSYLFRADIVKNAPDLASLYRLVGLEVNLRGLSFRDIRIVKEIHNNRPVLIVEGYIHNELDRVNRVPTIRAALQGYDSQEIYSWLTEPTVKRLRPYDRLRFQTRLESPPDAVTVQLRFSNRNHKKKSNEDIPG